MAKKARTPAPPRPVQAPRRRDTKSSGAGDDRKIRIGLGLFALTGVVGAAIALGIVLLGGHGKTKVAHPGPIDLANVPGLQKGPAPWPVEFANMADRLTPLGLSAYSGEQLKYHVHQHLDILINGKRVPVPANVGVDPGYITQLHSHNTTGVIHVESPTKGLYSLDQYILEWGVRFTPTCLGAYCTGQGGKRWHVYVNGQPYRGPMTKIPLKGHTEILLAYGLMPPAKIPKSYKWAGL